MSTITDWLMVVITCVYVVATIFIMIENRKSAKTSSQQLAESKLQFDESRRLQVLPYLQIHISTAIVNDIEKNESIVQIFLEKGDQNDGNELKFVCVVCKGNSIIKHMISEELEEKTLFFTITIINNGEGIAHHIDFEIEYKKQVFGVPGEYIIPAHGGTLSGSIALVSSYLNSAELEKIKEKRPGCIPVDISVITLNLQYQDVLGNTYKQSINSALMRYADRIQLSTDDYFISAPELMKQQSNIKTDPH